MWPEIRLTSWHRQKVGRKALTSGRCKQTVAPEKFNVAIDEKLVPTRRSRAITVQLTGPPCRGVGGEREQPRPDRSSPNLQVAISSEDDELGARGSGSSIHAEKVADVAVVERGVVRGGLFDCVARTNPHLEMRPRHFVGKCLEVSGWTASANKFHRAAIGDGDLRRELIAMIGGKQMKAQADLSQVVGALGHRCSGGAAIVRRQGEQQHDANDRDYHQHFYERQRVRRLLQRNGSHSAPQT